MTDTYRNKQVKKHWHLNLSDRAPTSMLMLDRTFLACVLLTVVCSAELNGQKRSRDALSFDRVVRAQMDSGFSGVALVARHDSVLLYKAYSKGSARLDTLSAFWIGSNSKGFTAAAILRLQELGRLRVRDPISSLFSHVPPDKRTITIHQLLTHSAGFGACERSNVEQSRAQAVNELLSCKLAYPPGTSYQYGNESYVLLAAIVEQVSHEKFERFVQKELLARAGLSSTGYYPAPLGARVAPGSGIVDTPRWTWLGASGMFSTAGDLYHWTEALRTGRVLTHASALAAMSPQRFARRDGTTIVSYGYGWGVETDAAGNQFVRHFGRDYRASSAILLLPNGCTIVVESHADGIANVSWSARVSNALKSACAAA